ncbi:hypothetical protein ACFFGH_29335 [Lysobacter korlensis]|uniref:SGNH hydrolase-type esterase domain-containing protein n=1 Tax=Lysobacter korlensis TaxID=553636 RepID=A0ABV6RYA1_9GAMM
MDSQWGRPFRVLAVGGAPVPGEGLRGGRLGLPERLAEELSDALGREVQVDALGDRTLTLAAAAASLTPEALAGQDVVLLRLGTDEALRTLRLNLWRRRMSALLDRLNALTPPSTRILVVGVPAVQSLPGSERDDLSAARKHAKRLNRVTRRLVRTSAKASFVRLPRAERDLELQPAPETYWRLARFLAPQIARRLPATPSVPAGAVDRILARFTERIDQLPSDGSERLLRLVSHARMSFGTRYAALALADETGSWRYWSLGWDADDRAAGAHAAILGSDAADVVTDARQDDRFSGLGSTVDDRIGFFAGARVQWSGVPVGALYVFDGAHRSGGRLDERLLRSLTRMVEQELRALLAERHSLTDAVRPLPAEPTVSTGPQFALTA